MEQNASFYLYLSFSLTLSLSSSYLKITNAYTDCIGRFLSNYYV